MLIVSDASPIIAPAVCDKLDLIDKLFDRVYIPQTVFIELKSKDLKLSAGLMYMLTGLVLFKGL